jgi:hypothetical protein
VGTQALAERQTKEKRKKEGYLKVFFLRQPFFT